MLRLLFCVLCVSCRAGVTLVAGAVGGGRSPHFLWPLGNSTVQSEVMRGHDANLPDASQCFVFQQGYPGLPYTAITLGAPGAFIDMHFAGELNFQDLSLSFYVYPDAAGTQGTLLSYRCPTGNVIRLAVMQGLLFVSFWDEYGVSVGMTAIPELINDQAWNHVVLSRDYSTGNLQLYHDGELVEDLDDDFPNKIQLPTTGVLRLGKGQGDADPGFRGRYACLQFFDVVLSRDDVRNVAANCRPDSWNLQPSVRLETRDVNGEERQCVMDYVPRPLVEPIDVQVKAVKCDVMGMHCVTGSNAWRVVMRKHKWSDSGRATAYFQLLARGRLPALPEDDARLLGKVSASDRRVCFRLCMRIEGCLSFAVSSGARSPEAGAPGSGVTCFLYGSVLDSAAAQTQASEGARYYALRAPAA